MECVGSNKRTMYRLTNGEKEGLKRVNDSISRDSGVGELMYGC